MDDDQQFCLRWNNHQSTLISVFDTLLENQTLVDCTLAAEGKFLKAHKVVLSACSPYFATLLQEQYDKHPIFILKDVKFQELRAMMDYMYRGEVNISQDQLAALLKAAESLQIKGLSDNRSTGNINPAPKLDGAHQQHRNLNVGANVGIKIGGGYTLEQTKRTRLGPNALDVQEMSGSREGSSSPSRRRKKVRRRSIEASLADIQHDNSNSSLQQQSNVVISAPGISNVNPISAAASVLAAAQLPSGATPGTVVGTSQTVASSSSSAAAAAAAAVAAANIAPGLVAAATQQMLTNVTKKTESVKGASASSEAMNTEDLATGVSVDEQEQQQTASKVDKHNHKYKATSGKDTSDIVEPKSEYDDDGNEGTVEDLTLDEEDMGIDDLDQNAGTSHVGEGSSQGYAPWQHERSQDDLLMTQQDAQQRDPQAKLDKSEQTDISPEEYELDDCLLESNDIVITQNKDGFVLHVKKLGGSITTAKLGSNDEEEVATTAVTAVRSSSECLSQSSQHSIIASLNTGQSIKLPSTECELINLKKMVPVTTNIQPQQQHQQTQQQHHQQQQPQAHTQQPHQIHQIHQMPQEIHQEPHETSLVDNMVATPTTTGIAAAAAAATLPTQTINLLGLRNVQITEQPKPSNQILSRIKYSRGKLITTQAAATTANMQIIETHDNSSTQSVGPTELSECGKYEISEIDLNNTATSATIISDLVKYAEIDDIELPDGTKIGIGFAPSDITEHQLQQTSNNNTPQIKVETSNVHHQLQLQNTIHNVQQQMRQLQDHDEATTSVEECILPDGIELQEQPLTKSYTILTTRPVKQELSGCSNSSLMASVEGLEVSNVSAECGESNTTTYELSLSDSSMHPDDTKYVCRHCGKKYRWKSTLRRHENVECGGKEPCHPCPHCSYKAKQRGNLGVHVRKHHPDKPQLASKRGRK